MQPRHCGRDENGAVLVEVTVVMTIMFVFILGSIEFLFALYQWNAATKAVQIGARIAAVSDPVAVGLNNLSLAVVSASVPPGSAMPNFVITCDGATASCTCNTMGACPGVGGYDQAAMNTIVFGRGSSSCFDATSYYDTGMCDIFPSIRPENVVIVYAQTGLGYAGRPGGPVPTITISIQKLPFRFFFLSGLRGFKDIPIPASTTSITAEHLSSNAPSF
ncbi:MAG TPA: TadE family protein [Xanthobacteraceae bacterium]|jgi:Flp pilus assembly pilin Flp